MTSRRITALATAAVGIAAAATSIGRILVANREALSTLVWAEDGLFPLCVKVHGVLPCSLDQYAGYLLVVPRLLAWPISVFPIDSWAAVTNIAAGVVAGILAAAVFLVLRARNTGWAASGLIALLPVIVPIVGFESVNSIASVNVLLLYLSAIMLAFPSPATPAWVYGVLLLLTALTVPSAAVLALPLVIQGLRSRLSRRTLVFAGGGLLLGLGIQAVAAATAAAPREIAVSMSTLSEWASSIPRAFATLVPGTTDLDFNGSLVTEPIRGLTWLGPLLVIVIILGGVALLIARSDAANGVGLLLITGLAAGAIPSLIGFANHRYLVIPLILWLAAAVLAVDAWVPFREPVLVTVAVVAVVSWSSTMPASDFRTVPSPLWADMLGAARADCSWEPRGDVALQFTPLWPYADAQFPGVTSNIVPCSTLGELVPQGLVVQ